jgi:hypothetical protein
MLTSSRLTYRITILVWSWLPHLHTNDVQAVQAGLGYRVGTLMGSAISTNLYFLCRPPTNQLSDIVAVSMSQTSSFRVRHSCSQRPGFERVHDRNTRTTHNLVTEYHTDLCCGRVDTDKQVWRVVGYNPS